MSRAVAKRSGSTTQPDSADCSLVADVSCQIGEAPLWHPDLECLLFVDIALGTVYAYDPKTNGCRTFSQGPVTGGMVLEEARTVLLFQDGRISRLFLDGRQIELARGLCPGNDRFNDIIADPEGRVFAGTIGGDGRLLRFDPDGTITEVLDGLGVPNGMGFSPDQRHMYFTDSLARRIYRFEYQRKSGAISNCPTFAEVPKDDGVPDGMAVDSEGFVWSAIWFGGCVRRYAPDGSVDTEVHLPVRQTSAVAFAGAGQREIFVTTAASDVADSMMPPHYDRRAPRGGGLYAFRVERISGMPLFRARIAFR